MERLDSGLACNPFRRSCDGQPASVLDQRMLIAEAMELAHGYRHLTVMHGDPATVAESRALDAFYDTVRHLARDLPWARVRGDRYAITITVRGPDAAQQLAIFAAAADMADPGSWTIAWTAVASTP